MPKPPNAKMPETKPRIGVEYDESEVRVPSGAFDHDNCGETFSPLQFGPRAAMSPTFFGNISPSLKSAEERMNTSAAPAGAAPAAKAVIRRRAVARVRVIGSGSVDWRSDHPGGGAALSKVGGQLAALSKLGL